MYCLHNYRRTTDGTLMCTNCGHTFEHDGFEAGAL